MLFYMYVGRALDHGWLRSCPGFDALLSTAFAERLAEVHLRDQLAVHPQRTRRPEEASLFYIPLWDVVSATLGDCNGTTHAQRMRRSSQALRASPWFRPKGSSAAGWDHSLASTGCTDNHLVHMGERLGRPLASTLRAAIVGRDRAYSSFYR